MKASFMERLKNTANKQHFIDETIEMLSPFGSVKRSHLVVDKKDRGTDVLCFVEMDTPQQAVAAEKALGILLLDGSHLFFSTQLSANFAD